jgi:transposase
MLFIVSFYGINSLLANHFLGKGKNMKISFRKYIVNRLEKELRIAERLNNLRLYKMVKCLLLINEQVGFKHIAELLNISVKTVYNWLKRFLLERFSWLLGYHYKGRGRKPKLDKMQKAKLYNIVDNGPEKYGFDCGVWNCAMIVEVIQREFKVTYNPKYLPTLLKKIGLTYQKAKFVSDRMDNEEHQKKREEWENKTWPQILKRARQMKGVILFEDEVSFAQWGSLARTWAPKGKQPQVKTCGKRKGLKIFGAIEFQSGNFHYMEQDGRFNSESYIVFLKQIIASYSCPIFLIEDGASYHKSKIVTEFKQKMEDENQLYVYRLPSYSPDKNPIEKLWKNTKKDATHLKYFPSFEDLRSAVIGAFNKYLADAMKVVCVMKKLRAQAGIQ